MHLYSELCSLIQMKHREGPILKQQQQQQQRIPSASVSPWKQGPFRFQNLGRSLYIYLVWLDNSTSSSIDICHNYLSSERETYLEHTSCRNIEQ